MIEDKRFICMECGKEVSSPVPKRCYLIANVICHECLDKMPKEVVDKFFEELEKAGEGRRI